MGKFYAIGVGLGDAGLLTLEGGGLDARAPMREKDRRSRAVKMDCIARRHTHTIPGGSLLGFWKVVFNDADQFRLYLFSAVPGDRGANGFFIKVLGEHAA